MKFSQPVTELIKDRFSCRKYRDYISEQDEKKLQAFINELVKAPFGSHAGFYIIKNRNKSPISFNKLGTYGFIRGKFDYIAGAIKNTEKAIKDFGYLAELIALFATDIGLGTCWLGGTFTKSRFAQIIRLEDDHIIPAVLSIGKIANPEKSRSGIISLIAGAKTRKPWEKLFFLNNFDNPLDKKSLKEYAICLEMVRLAPSGSNLQPWRIVYKDSCFHFYLKRSKNYMENIAFKIMKCSDIQAMDIGIAMCHFEITAVGMGLSGSWNITDPKINLPDHLYEYISTWIPKNNKPKASTIFLA